MRSASCAAGARAISRVLSPHPTTGAPPIGILKYDSNQVIMGPLGICVAGFTIGGAWFTWISGRKPRTLTPAWAAATAKYRAAQNQDPITNQ